MKWFLIAAFCVSAHVYCIFKSDIYGDNTFDNPTGLTRHDLHLCHSFRMWDRMYVCTHITQHSNHGGPKFLLDAIPSR